MRKQSVIVCSRCDSKIKISELKPVFREEYVNPDGSFKLSEEELLAGGWASKILKGLACPKCGEILAEPEE